MGADARPRISVEAALRRGQWTVNGPVYIFLFGIPVAVFALCVLIGVDRDVAQAYAVIAFIVGWPLAWLSWSIQVPKWKVWAYERVDDLEELKSRAVAGKLIWPDGHLFGRTEIWTPALRLRQQEIEEARWRRT